MGQKLVIFLHTEDLAQASAVVLAQDGAVLETIPSTTLAALTSQAEGREVIVIIPAEDVLLMATSLPQMNHQRLRKALPYALEERVIGNVDELHFAMGDYLPNGELVVAVVAKQKMQAWIQALREYQIEATCMLPLSLIVPWAEDTWSVAIFAEVAIVKTAAFYGFACDVANLQTILLLKLQEGTNKPHSIHVFNYTQTSILPLTIGDCVIKEVVYPVEHSLVDLANVAQQHPVSLNLLQGAYQAKRQWRQLKNTWMVSGILIAACVAMVFFSQIISYFILSSRSHKVEQEIATIYHQQFPGAHTVVAAKERMQDKLQKLLGQATGDPLFALLAAVGKGIIQTPQVNLERFDFQHNQITLNVTAVSFDALDTFSRFLKQQGLSVKQENATSVDSRAKADLVVQSR
ncbi:MAG: hypothetical protein A3E84_03600 [Gammaproteobacteria bacterium RIFCSPHIGHO2_12_FULL_42_13]|nr:MAG: hypothetical protein A3E84_03600 [Gammaproteobacteria bacterium RIFCSPHIGHO2_12_FULL_42_13]